MKRLLAICMAFVLTFLSLPSYIVVAENINTTERETTGEEIKKEDGQDQESLLDGDQPVTSAEAGVSVDAPSAILMEASTGQVIFEKEADTPLRPASITKIMTLILIFDALESGKIKLTDEVVTSAYAKSMGGSQVFLEEGEKQTVETLIKCIVIASANDASVVMAEYIAGTEEEFVIMMNQRAKELGMNNTNFEDCCGLTDSATHLTSARDVAIMSRELITKYPKIFDYSTIWMENIIHTTEKGSSEFGLTNTNKLIRTYEGAKGLKTGSTSLAKYCLSAVAERNGIELISVIMAAPDYKVRFKDASNLLNYGFAKSNLYTDLNEDVLPDQKVDQGVEEVVPIEYKGPFRYLDTTGTPLDQVEKEFIINESHQAPIEKGTKAGYVTYTLEGKELGTVDIFYSKSVRKATYKDHLWRIFQELCV